MDRNYNTISPSAAYLVKLKAFTSIPFAKEAAAIMGDAFQIKELQNDLADKKGFFKKLFHFENRYRTVEKLLLRLQPKNILEISSGFSFRGLDMCLQQPVHFIDTDLPDVIAAKNNITMQLLAGSNHQMKGKLEVLPLNVMNKADFMEVTRRFAAGPVTIINEGLLVYLNEEEKKQLCTTIYEILLERGGHWITGDIYIKKGTEKERGIEGAEWSAFRKEHKLDENRFTDFETAERFFIECGLHVFEREAYAIEQLSCLQLLGYKKEDILKRLQSASPVHETWRLGIKKTSD